MPFALPLALELVGVVQVQLLAEHKKAGQHMLGDCQAICPCGIGEDRPLRQPSRHAIAFGPRIVQLYPFQVFCFFQLSGAFKVPQKDVRFPEKFLSHITFQAENNVLRPFGCGENQGFLFLRKRRGHYNFHAWPPFSQLFSVSSMAFTLSVRFRPLQCPRPHAFPG